MNALKKMIQSNHTLGQYLDSGEDVSVNTDRIPKNWDPIHTDGRRPSVCIDKIPILRNEVCIYRYVQARVKVFSL